MRSLLMFAAPFFSALSSAYSYYGNAPKTSEAQYRANAVKEAFQIAWDGYYTYAFPNDELLPVNNSYENSRNGWGASAVDAFSTAILMELPEIVDTILTYIPTIDFSVSKDDEVVSVFETTIRYIGGMLSGYDLLTGPYANLVNDTSDVSALLTQASKLADHLSFAFDTPTGIPYNTVYLNNHSFSGGDSNGLATIGTLVIEWTRLSDLTGNNTYADLTQKAESYLLYPAPNSSEPFPGLLGTKVNITTGLFLDAAGGWGGSDDSFYEYLIKSYIYDSSRFAHYKDRWIVAADSSIEYLAGHPSTRPDLTFLSNFNGTTILNTSSHLACFDGGNFILGGLVLDSQQYVDFGLDLVAGCHDTYASTLTGIGPESFSWNPSTVPATQEALYETAGFYITDSTYILRPEVIESFYYAYRATGNTTYQDWAWNAFVAVNATTRVGSGLSGILDVNAVGGGGYKNFQESFLFAEFFKYAFLIQAEDAKVQVRGDGTQDWVLNTEGHPLRVFGPRV